MSSTLSSPVRRGPIYDCANVVSLLPIMLVLYQVYSEMPVTRGSMLAPLSITRSSNIVH